MAKRHTVTNADVFAVVEYLNRIVALPVTEKNGMALSLAFRALARELEPLAKDLNELRSGFITEFSDKDEDGKPIVNEDGMVTFADGGQEKFVQAMTDMMKKTVAINNPIAEEKLVYGAEWLAPAFAGEPDGVGLAAIYPFCSQ